MTIMGPNDVRRAVWAICEIFLLLSSSFLYFIDVFLHLDQVYGHPQPSWYQ